MTLDSVTSKIGSFVTTAVIIFDAHFWKINLFLLGYLLGTLMRVSQPISWVAFAQYVAITTVSLFIVVGAATVFAIFLWPVYAGRMRGDS